MFLYNLAPMHSSLSSLMHLQAARAMHGTYVTAVWAVHRSSCVCVGAAAGGESDEILPFSRYTHMRPYRQ